MKPHFDREEDVARSYRTRASTKRMRWSNVSRLQIRTIPSARQGWPHRPPIASSRRRRCGRPTCEKFVPNLPWRPPFGYSASPGHKPHGRSGHTTQDPLPLDFDAIFMSALLRDETCLRGCYETYAAPRQAIEWIRRIMHWRFRPVPISRDRPKA